MISGPCKDCTERYVGCHSKCEKYVDFRKRLDAENEIRHKKITELVERRSYVHDRARAIKRRCGTKGT